MKLTLDWNCVIEVEVGGPQSIHVKNIVKAHRYGEFEVALLAASASENSKSKMFPGNAKFFKQRIAKLDWNDLPLVPMPGIHGLSYWDFSYYVEDSGAFERDMSALWQVIAPNVPRDPAEHLAEGHSLSDDSIQAKELSKWRNTWCDIISAYSHIHACRDIFVTNNTRDFQKNAIALGTIGMKHISTPEKTLGLVNRLRKV